MADDQISSQARPDPPPVNLADKTPGHSWTSDRKLAQAVAEGSISAWHIFIDRFTPLLYSVIRHYVFTEDEVRTLYVSVLELLYKEKLSTFEGRASLSTWLVLVARHQCLDFVRRAKGRWVVPRTVERLPKQDQRVFELYFVEGFPLDEVKRQLRNGNGASPDLHSIVDSIERIHTRVDPRVFKRLMARTHADSMGVEASRLVEYVNAVRNELESRSGETSPEFQMIAEEAGRRAREVLRIVGELKPEEKRLLALRFGEGLTAREIASELEVKESWRVYKMLDRCLNRLRGVLSRKGIDSL